MLNPEKMRKYRQKEYRREKKCRKETANENTQEHESEATRIKAQERGKDKPKNVR